MSRREIDALYSLIFFDSVTRFRRNRLPFSPYFYYELISILFLWKFFEKKLKKVAIQNIKKNF